MERSLLNNEWIKNFIIAFGALIFEYLIFLPIWNYFSLSVSEGFDFNTVATIIICLTILLIVYEYLTSNGSIKKRNLYMLPIGFSLVLFLIGFVYSNKTYIEKDLNYSVEKMHFKGLLLKEKYKSIKKDSCFEDADRLSFHKCVGDVKIWRYPSFFKIFYKVLIILGFNYLLFLGVILYKVVYSKSLAIA